MTGLRKATLWLFWGAVAALAGGYLGWLHPIGDSLAVFRFQAAAAVILLALCLWRSWRLTLPAAAAAAVAAGGTISHAPEPVPAGENDLVLYQQNLWFSRRDDAEWLAAIRDVQPDVITLQEVSHRSDALLEALSADYPSFQRCRFGDFVDVAVLSKLPVVPGSKRCGAGTGLAVMQVAAETGPVWLVSLHLHWPWPFSQARQLDRAEAILRELDGPVVLAGDFNSVAWSHAVARVGDAARIERVGPVVGTFDLPYLGMKIGIDHVLARPAPGQSIMVMPKLGSDHNGVLARLAWPGRG